MTMLLVALLALAVVRAQAPNSNAVTDPGLPTLSSVPLRPLTTSVLTTSASPLASVSGASAVPTTTRLGVLTTTALANKPPLTVVTLTASAAAPTTTSSPSSSKSGGEIAAIVLGVLCALEAIVIAILALRTRNLARRSAHLARTLRDLPPPQAPIATPMHVAPLMKPMNVLHVSPPPATVERKVSRKAPPKYEEHDKKDAA